MQAKTLLFFFCCRPLSMSYCVVAVSHCIGTCKTRLAFSLLPHAYSAASRPASNTQRPRATPSAQEHGHYARILQLQTYSTVTVPFMPAPSCGSQWNAYLPGLVNFVVTSSPGAFR